MQILGEMVVLMLLKACSIRYLMSSVDFPALMFVENECILLEFCFFV
jgi:hypothetical protein